MNFSCIKLFSLCLLFTGFFSSAVAANSMRNKAQVLELIQTPVLEKFCSSALTNWKSFDELRNVYQILSRAERRYWGLPEDAPVAPESFLSPLKQSIREIYPSADAYWELSNTSPENSTQAEWRVGYNTIRECFLLEEYLIHKNKNYKNRYKEFHLKAQKLTEKRNKSDRTLSGTQTRKINKDN